MSPTAPASRNASLSRLRRFAHLGAAATLVGLLATAGLVVSPPSSASADPASDVAQFLANTNQQRAEHGSAALASDAGLAGVAGGWSQAKASSDRLSHNPNLAGELDLVVPSW
jgi:uncharacterized protein YkwD